MRYAAGMGRPLRAAVGGLVYHVLNRANGRWPLFDKPADYEAFERVLGEAQLEHPVPLLAYCVMPNHWHLVLAPEGDGDLSRFVAWLTLTHTQRWHAHRHTAGNGHLYQGRFKSFAVETDEHFLTLCRYVERNPLRARLVQRAEEWRWSSMWRRAQLAAEPALQLAEWPVPRPSTWGEWVNAPQTAAEETAVPRSVRRGQAFGSGGWVKRTVEQLGQEITIQAIGRPRQRPGQGAWLAFEGNGC
jgi:putative transposase